MHTETTDKQWMSRITSTEAREIKDGLDSMDGYLGGRHERSEVKLASERDPDRLWLRPARTTHLHELLERSL